MILRTRSAVTISRAKNRNSETRAQTFSRLLSTETGDGCGKGWECAADRLRGDPHCEQYRRSAVLSVPQTGHAIPDAGGKGYRETGSGCGAATRLGADPEGARGAGGAAARGAPTAPPARSEGPSMMVCFRERGSLNVKTALPMRKLSPS
jgi:hypothetical protein